MYDYKNCKFYSECIAISTDAASFNVEIFHESDFTAREKIGKANVMISRHPARIKNGNNVASQIFNGEINNVQKLHDCLTEHCANRCLAL